MSLMLDRVKSLMKSRSGTTPYRMSTLANTTKLGGIIPAGIGQKLKNLANPAHHMGEEGWEIGGLGILAAPALDNLQARARARISGDTADGAYKKRRFMPDVAHEAVDAGGLGLLAVPAAIKARKYLGAKHASVDFICMLDELTKIGTVTPEQAAESLKRYEKLQDNAPTAGQVGRYMGIGAVATPAIGALRNKIKGEQVFKAVTGPGGKAIPYGRLRHAGSLAVAGALTSGAIPVLRHHLDQAAEKKKLIDFMYPQE